MREYRRSGPVRAVDRDRREEIERGLPMPESKGGKREAVHHPRVRGGRTRSCGLARGGSRFGHVQPGKLRSPFGLDEGPIQVAAAGLLLQSIEVAQSRQHTTAGREGSRDLNLRSQIRRRDRSRLPKQVETLGLATNAAKDGGPEKDVVCGRKTVVRSKMSTGVVCL